MFNMNLPNEDGEWLSVEGDDDDDVIARFNDGEHQITVITVDGTDQQDEYMTPSAVQTADDAVMILISRAGLTQIMEQQMAILKSIPEIQERCAAAFASTMGMMLMIGVHKLSQEN